MCENPSRSKIPSLNRSNIYIVAETSFANVGWGGTPCGWVNGECTIPIGSNLIAAIIRSLRYQGKGIFCYHAIREPEAAGIFVCVGYFSVAEPFEVNLSQLFLLLSRLQKFI